MPDPSPDRLSLELLRQIDALCDRFEDALAAGEQPAVSAYLEQVTDRAQPALLRELLRLQLQDAAPADSDARRSQLATPDFAVLHEALATDRVQNAVTLTVMVGPHRGTVLRLSGPGTFTIGRAPECHLPLPQDLYLSRHHLLLEFQPPACRVVDLGSHNGIFVNGQRVHGPTELRHGDQIAAGQTSLRVEL